MNIELILDRPRDRNMQEGVVYVWSEDGSLRSTSQGHREIDHGGLDVQVTDLMMTWRMERGCWLEGSPEAYRQLRSEMREAEPAEGTPMSTDTES